MKVHHRATVKAGIVLVSYSALSDAFVPQLQLPTKSESCTTRTKLFESIQENETDSLSLVSTKESQEVQSLKSDLVDLANRTNRGFTASAGDKKKVNDIVESLKLLRTISEPAKSYYDQSTISTPTTTPTLSGKWTLIYTDAPDITGLDTSRNPFSTAKLGRIGQECSPPYIKNVIEWVRPDWAKDLLFSGSDESRILQKVVTTGSATESEPNVVDLKIAGLELEAGKTKDEVTNYSKTDNNNVIESIQSKGLPAGILSMNPIDLKGPLNPPFGRFEILYLDEEFRIIRTSTNYLAINRRIVDKSEEWF